MSSLSSSDSPSVSLRKRFGSKLFSSSSNGIPSKLSLDQHNDDNLSCSSFDTSGNNNGERISPSMLGSMTLSPSRSFRKLLPRNSALGLRERKISDPDLSMEDVSMNSCESARRMEKALQHKDFRNDVVDGLLGNHSEDVRKVRLLCAVNEVLRTSDRKERSTKANMVVTLFVKDDAKFLVRGIPLGIQSDLIVFKLEGFIQLRNAISRDLIRNSHVLQMLVEFEEKSKEEEEGDAMEVVKTLDCLDDDDDLDSQ